MQDLDKIEAIRERFPLSYVEAGEALGQADGDLLQALDRLEKQSSQRKQRMQGHVEDLLEEYERK